MDVWDFRGASVAWGGHEVVASTFGASPPTFGGVSGDVVDVGPGTKAAFDAAEAEHGDLSGKIALVDFQPDWWWVNFPGHEADLRGIAAIVLTSAPIHLSYYTDPTALGSNDGEYSTMAAVRLHQPQRGRPSQGGRRRRGAGGATVVNDVRVTMAADGGSATTSSLP